MIIASPNKICAFFSLSFRDAAQRPSLLTLLRTATIMFLFAFLILVLNKGQIDFWTDRIVERSGCSQTQLIPIPRYRDLCRRYRVVSWIFTTGFLCCSLGGMSFHASSWVRARMVVNFLLYHFKRRLHEV